MQLVRITNVEHCKFKNSNGLKVTYLENGKTKNNVIFENSAMFPAACLLTVGDELEVGTERSEDGKYLNITYLGPVLNQSETMVDEKLPPVISSGISNIAIKENYNFGQDKQRKSIEMQVSIKSAVELITGTGIKFKTVDEATDVAISTARKFYDYIAERIPVREESSAE